MKINNLISKINIFNKLANKTVPGFMGMPLPLKPPGSKDEPPPPYILAPGKKTEEIKETEKSNIKPKDLFSGVEIIRRKKPGVQSKKETIKTLKEISSSLREDQKIIFCRNPFSQFDVTQQSSEFGIGVGENPVGEKPLGLWYAGGSSWIRFDMYSDEDWAYEAESAYARNYIYQIDINKSNMINISNLNQLQDFTNKYLAEKMVAAPQFGNILIPLGNGIDWRKVSNDYDGIEIIPYISNYNEGENTYWYSTWDIPSGCIWNSGAFKNIKLLAKRIEGDKWEVYE